jgi:hypothetical protein
MRETIHLWWKHTRWNPKVDGIVELTVESKKWKFLVVDGEMIVRCLMLWLFSIQLCLYIDNVHYVCIYVWGQLLCFYVFVGCILCGVDVFAWISWWTSTKNMEELKRIRKGVWGISSIMFWDEEKINGSFLILANI